MRKGNPSFFKKFIFVFFGLQIAGKRINKYIAGE